MNIKRITLQLLCLLLLLLSFTSVAHGSYVILDESFSLNEENPTMQFPFDLPAGDNITIFIEIHASTPEPINFSIHNGTDTMYSRTVITRLEDVWIVPAEGHYDFLFTKITANVPLHVILGSEIIPEFPTWTSMLLILFSLTIAIVIYKRRLLKTPIH